MGEPKFKRHPLATAWDEWAASDEGLGCLDDSGKPIRNPYLKNRLAKAFNAGAAAQEALAAEPPGREAPNQTEETKQHE